MKAVPLFRQIAVTTAVALASIYAVASPVIFASGGGTSLSGTAYSGSVYNSNFIDTRNYSTSTLDITAGASSTSSTRNFQDTGTGAIFDFVFDHARAGDSNGQANTGASMWFRVRTDTSYELSGFYSLTGRAGSGLSAQIRDYTAGVDLFYDRGISRDTVNENFILGVANDGDQINSTSGSLSGVLLANRDYYFSFSGDIFQTGFADSGATANGCVTLRIGGATGGVECGQQVGTGTAVPEPGSLALVAAAMLAGGLIRRKKSSA